MKKIDKIRGLYLSDGNDPLIRNKLVKLIEELMEGIDSMKVHGSPILNGSIQDVNYHALRLKKVPKSGRSIERLVKNLLEDASGHPIQTADYATNAIPMITIPSLAAYVLGMTLNSNPVWEVYGPLSRKKEIAVSDMIFDLMNYDSSHATGYFTYGGGGGNLAAGRLGLAKSYDDVQKRKEYLMKGRPDNTYFITSDVSHFTVATAAITCGIGMDKVLKIKTGLDNSMDTQCLEETMRAIIRDGGKIGTIYATMGTTDGFGIDDIGKIAKIRNKLKKEYHLDYTPHIHADLAMGGMFIFFNLYDFNKNSLGIDSATLKSLSQIRDRMSNINVADSFMIDFHKLGQTPYISTLFGVKNKKDLSLVDMSEYSPYINERDYGKGHTLFAIECSRTAGALAAFANLMTFGVEGYQTLLSHYIEMSNLFRRKLKSVEGVEVMNNQNPAPVTIFRHYPDKHYSRQIAEKEINGHASIAEIESINRYNRQIMVAHGMNRNLVFFGDTDSYRAVPCIDSSKIIGINAMKYFVISPYTNPQSVDYAVQRIAEVQKQARVNLSRSK